MPVFAQPLSILLLAQETLPAASGPAAGDVAAPPHGGDELADSVRVLGADALHDLDGRAEATQATRSTDGLPEEA